MKVYIDTDERYPDYLVSDTQGYYTDAIDVDQATLDRWAEAERLYRQRADEIEAALVTARTPPPPMTKALLEQRRQGGSA